MKIDVSEAKISTAKVEIKTLTVNGKQVTLAVFRQIEIGRLINYDKEKGFYLNGLPWGRVNYHSNQCSHIFSPHMHIVWQFGSELRKDFVKKSDIDISIMNGREEGDIDARLEKLFSQYDVLFNKLLSLPLLFIAV